MSHQIGHIDNHSSPEDKIALFRSLFRGRDDVYPRRFESRRTGKSGYQPACANEWVRDVCEKPRIKCAECAYRRFLPVTDDAIRRHLSGQDGESREFVMGIYPMLLDETCFFLAIDFDKAHWRDDVTAVLETCRNMDLPIALERSRSGNGGHVWFFFDEAIPAAMARRLGSHVLTETMERRPEIGLDSYDRFFPNQDTLPQGGFGNLIALPLQHRPRGDGNTVFLDEQLAPHADQWALLSQIRKLARRQIEDVVHHAEGKGRIIGVRLALADEKDAAPWAAPPSRRWKEIPISEPLPANLELVLGDGIYVAKDALPPALRNRLLRLAAFQNPEFYKAQTMRLPTYDKPRIIACAEEYANHVCLPRGCLDELRQLLSRLKIKSAIRDERCAGSSLDAAFHGQLRSQQQAAADALLAHDTGVLSATTAFGKTVVAAWLIARRGVSTLVLVHRRQLLEQWLERLSMFLGLNKREIGRIGGGRKKPTGVLEHVAPEQAQQIEELLTYEEDTAGGIMTKRLVVLPADATVRRAIEEIRTSFPDEDLHNIYVVDGDRRLANVVPLRRLVLNEKDVRLGTIGDPNPVAVHVRDDQEEVIHVMSKYDLAAVPVIDDDGRLLGRITHDDVMDAYEQEADEDIYHMAGLAVAETGKASIVRAAGLRLSWLVPCLASMAITATVMVAAQHWFEELGVYAALIIFVPMIAAIGGNCGIQISTVIVRGMATGDLAESRFDTALMREGRIALIMAPLCGVAAWLISHFGLPIMQRLSYSAAGANAERAAPGADVVRIAFAVGAGMTCAILIAASLGLEHFTLIRSGSRSV